MQENDAKYQIDLLTAMNEKLMDSEKVYRLVSEFTGLCFIYVDFRDPSNPHLIGDWAGITGLNVNSRNFDKNIMLSLMDEKDQKEFDDRIISIEKHGRDHDSMVFRSADKKEWIEAVVKVCYDKKGEPENKIYSFKNVTKDVRDDEELKYLAYYDSLTGLYNRNYFVKKLRDLCGRADEEKTCIELLFIDIDDFKKINDSLGLIYGDELVQDFSAFIKDMQDDNIFAGRFGSDVFSIAIYNPCGNRSAEAIYKEIRERLRKPYVLTNKTEVTFTVSAGVSEYPGDRKSVV